ncbi:acyl-CoA N-acyltransferase [Parathielavia appendiculata]|uniref:Acyl-CoA N-acyltransferase n=1 Tax=Parathielavia appendiculata TaxID=2587402 RepID=A0AAN6YYR9_9PEZI|nr:acyl-CoA N-acyltransferase [Parathielavia appendiculata]
MPLLVRPATEADSTRSGIIGRDAFRDIFHESLFPPHLAHKSETGDLELDEAQWRTTRNLRRIRDGQPTFVVLDAAEDASTAEEVVAVAHWQPPLQTPPSAAATFATKDPVPGSLDLKKAEEIFRVMTDETTKVLGPDWHENTWFLVHLAVDPNHQRRGIGKMLVRYGLDLAQKDGKDAFLISTPAGRGMYRSVGFRDVGEPFPICGIPHYPMMWTKPDPTLV